MNNRILQWAGIALLLQIGLLHLYAMMEAYNTTPFLGVLFAANGAAAMAAALGIYRRRRWGWMAGIVLALGSAAGYIASRTAGLPGMEIAAWGDATGTAALAVEGAFLVVALIARVWTRPQPTAAADDLVGQPIPTQAGMSRFGNWRKAVYPVAALLAVAVISAGVLYLDGGDALAFDSGGVKIVTITAAQFEEQYGIQVSRLASTAMSSVVDVRLKIIDVDKARVLLEDETKHPSLWIGDQTLPKTLIPTVEQICGPTGTLTFTRQNPRALVRPAHMNHTDKNLRNGGIYIMFYPNTQNLVKSGTPVSLFFGNTRLGPLTAQ